MKLSIHFPYVLSAYAYNVNSSVEACLAGGWRLDRGTESVDDARDKPNNT